MKHHALHPRADHSVRLSRPASQSSHGLRRWLALVAFGACAVIAEPEARAQARTEDRVAAESLFTDARRLMQAGDYERACPKLEASRRLEPGLGTTLNLADCYEKTGRTASAWAEFRSAAAEAQKVGDAARKSTALERAAALEPKLSRLQVDLSELTVSVFRNGEPLSAEVLGSAIPVDPGSYQLEARAPGKATWTQTVEVKAGAGLVRVEIPPLADAPATAEPIPSGLSEPPPPAMTDERSGTQRTWAWVVGGVGVASVAAGSTFGLLASSSWSKAKETCRDGRFECTEDGVAYEEDAKTRANIATVAFIVGGAALGTSLILFLTDSDEPASAELAISPSSVTLRGRF